MSRFLRFFKVFIVATICIFYGVSSYSDFGSSNATWATLTINDRDETTGSVPKPLYYPLSGCSRPGFRNAQVLGAPSCDDQIVESITPPTKNGWVYNGHYNNGLVETTYIDQDGHFTSALSNGISRDLTIYAKWTFSISYSTGGSATCTYGTTCAAAAAPEPPSSGQVFNGWACTLSNGGSCGVYPVGGDLANATNNTAGVTGITLTATWSSTAPTYVYKRVTLDPNGGTGGTQYIYEGFDGSDSLGFFTCQSASCNSTGSSCTCEGATAISGSIFDAGISRPTNGDNAFGGYYTLRNGGYERVDSEGFIKGELYSAAPTTIYAHWVEQQRVQLNPGDNGAWSHCAGVVYEYAGLPLTTIGNECEPTPYSGYTFTGYYDGNTQYYDSSLSPMLDAWPTSNAPNELVAGYEAVRYPVNYYCGDNLVRTEYVANNAPYTIWDGNGGTACGDPVSASPSSAGSRLAGWLRNFATEYGLGQNVSQFPITGPINLTSVTRSIYRVTLNHNGAENTPVPNQEVYFWNGNWYDNADATGLRTTMNPKPIKAGYDLGGYYTGTNGTGTLLIDMNGDFKVGASVSNNNSQITANWTAHPYTIQLDRGDGTCNNCSGYMYYRVDFGWAANNSFSGTPIPSITPPTPPTGDVFSGYYTGQNGTGTRVTDGNGNILVTGTDALNLVTQLQNLKFYAKYDDTPTAPTNPNEYFAVTTTAMDANTTFAFDLFASGDFWVDWDDGTIEHIVRNSVYDTAEYSHIYTTAAPSGKIIKIWGTANGYRNGTPAITFTEGMYGCSDCVGTTPLLVAGISGSFGSIFPTIGNGGSVTTVPSFASTFLGCTNLTGTIPADLFGYMDGGNYVGVTGSVPYMFNHTFADTGLMGTIPGTLFGRTVDGTYYGVSGAADNMFFDTFGRTNITSIPEGLFSGISGAAVNMFYGTFGGTNITSIPEGLFSGISGAADWMFASTFVGTNITSLPHGLFSGVTGTADHLFYNTFGGCSGLEGKYIPKDLFNLDGLTYDASNGMMYAVFTGTWLATSCDSFNLTHYQTDYDNSYWEGKVICAPAATFTCANSGVVGNPSGTPNPDVIWADEITGATTLPAGSGCVAPTHYTTANYWACTGNTNCTGNPSHWAAGGAKPSWLTSSLTQSVNFYMEYTPVTYSVALDANGGTAGGVTTLWEKYNTGWATTQNGTYSNNLTLTSAQRPSWAGHTFAGYYDSATEGQGNQMVDQNGHVVASATTLTDSNQTWYAHWSDGPYTVTFSCGDGGTWVDSTPLSNYSPQTGIIPGTGDIDVPLATACEKPGHLFSQWKIVANNALIPTSSNGGQYDWNHYFSSNIVPNWQPVETTITLSPNGGTWGSNVPEAGKSVYTIYGVGVYRDAERTEQMGTGGNPNTDNPWQYITLNFEANNSVKNQKTLTLDLGDANATFGGQTYTNGLVPQPILLPFTGFYDASTDGTQMIRGRVKANGNTEDNPGYITAAGTGSNGGPSYTSNQTWYAHWRPFTVPSINGVPERAGYVFDGWFTAASGGDRVTDGNGNTVCPDCVTQTISVDTTFYAHWIQCSHTFEQGTTPHATKENKTAVNGMCRYHITCDSPAGTGYSQHGGLYDETSAFDVTIAVDSSASLPGCLPREYRIYYENVTEHNGILPADAPGQYTYGIGATISAVPTSPTENFDSWCTNSGLNENCAATQTIGTTSIGDKYYYAKWSGCKTGYRTYNYDVWVTADYNNQSHSYPAGVCAPGDYVITCNNNCPAGETCNACFEDFISSSYHLGQRYGVYSQKFDNSTNQYGGVVGALGIVLTGQGLNGTFPFGGNAYGQSGDTSVSIRPMYSLNGIDGWVENNMQLPSNSIFLQDDYVAYMTNLAQLNGQTFGTSHYDFNGLWTDATSEDSQYRYLPTVNGTTPWSQRNADGKELSEFFASDATVYAHWIPHVYSVKLMQNHSGTDNNQVGTLYEEYGNGWNNANTGTFATNYQLPSDLIPSWTGYTFGGYWTTRDNSGTQVVTQVGNAWKVTAGAKTLGDSNQKWYAHWTPKQVTITLNPNAGAAHLADNGYTTKIYTKYATGVYKNSARTQQMTPSAYPVTKPNRYFTITYHKNDGTNETWNSNVNSVFNGYFNASSNPTKQYIGADEYITDGENGGINAGIGYTSNKTWYAKWIDGAHDLHLGVRDGYVFKGWYDAATGGNKVGEWMETITPTSDMTLYADWEQCNYSQVSDPNSTAVIQSMDSQNHPNQCRYLITCDPGYTINGGASLDYYGPAGEASGTLPDCSANEYTITYYDNPAYGAGELATQNYTYDPNNPVVLNPDLNATVFEDHRASSVEWCRNSNGTNCVTQIAPQNQTGDIALYARWTCATGYRTYEYETNTHEYGNGYNVLWAAGTCAPSRYRVSCHANCPNGETGCRACLEDFKLLSSSNAVGMYGFGSVYNGMAINQNACGFMSGGDLLPIPVYSKNNPGAGELFTSNYAITPCWVYNVSDALRAAYSDNKNYKTFMETLADEPYNSGLNFGAMHYNFDGLWTAADGGSKYIGADGLSPTGGYAFDTQEMSQFFTSDADVYAHWTPKVYTINLDKNASDANWGDAGVQKIKQKWNTNEGWLRVGGVVQWFTAGQFTLGQTSQYQDGRPTRSGYNFMGYWTEQQQEGQACPGTQIINADGTLNLNATSTAGDVQHATYFENENGSTIYACWQGASYNISYTLNGGTAGTDQPTIATYGADAFHVSNPVSHPHGTFKGWTISGMQSGVTHYYGTTNNPEYTDAGESLNLTNTNIQWFKDLRGNADQTVLFTAKWNCAPGYGGADCSEPGAHTVTIKTGYGVATVSANGWTANANATEITRTYNTDQTITLSTITANLKGGYTGRTYRVTVAGGGNLSGNTFTVGSGDATIYIDATGITTPVPTISGGATKVYNYQSTTLTGTVSNSTDYDSGISFTYRFGVSDTSDGTYEYTASNTNTKTIAKAAYLGTKYHKIEITAHGEGELASSAGVSATPTSVTLKNAPIRFNVGTGETLSDGSSPLYAPYNINGNLYSGEFSATDDTPATVPSAAKNHYDFDGWWTAATNGSKVYDADRTLTSNNVSGYVNGEKWVVTSTSGKDLYPHWNGVVYTITLNKNGASDGTSTFYEKYDTGYALSSNPTDWTTTSITVPTKTGHTFGGYYANSNFSGAQVIGTDGALPTNPKYFTQSKTLYAKWTANTYNISYNTNGGTAGTDQPETVTFGTVFHVDNPTPTGHQTSFAGWNVTGMQSGVTHYYGATSSVSAHGNGTSWNNTTITPSIQYFKNLRANADATVNFTAVWNCEYPYLAPDCSSTGGVKVTVNPGAGVSAVTGVGDGWISDGSGSVYKYFVVGASITLASAVAPELKGGYTATGGYAYTKTSSGAGTLNNGVFTVGDGDAEITVAATGIVAPVPTISGGATKVYNYQDITLMAGDSNGTNYDTSISVVYEFGHSATSNGTPGTWVESTNADPKILTILKNAFREKRYYRAKIIASGEGGFSATGTSAGYAEVTLKNAPVAFSVGTGETLSGASPRYVAYDDGNLYDGEFSSTEANVPSATKNYYDFAGWWTSATSGNMVYDANGDLTNTSVQGYVSYADGETKWVVTNPNTNNGVTLYPHWNGKVYKLNLNKNDGTNGSVTVLNEKYGTGWRIGNSGNFSSSVSLSGNQLPTKTGHTFIGYYDAATNGNPKGAFTNGTWTTPESTAITGTTTWYAHWTPKQYTVTYNCGIGGGAGSTDNSPKYDENYAPKTLAQANCATSHEGYYFNGWNVSNTNPQEVKQSGVQFQWKYTENKTFTANWQPKTYHITFNKNEGNGGTNEIWEVYDENWRDAGETQISTIVLPTRRGHTFMGYALNGVTYISGATLPAATLSFGDTSGDATVDITLTAQWTPITYTIDYDENGGSRTLPAGYSQVEYVKNAASTYVQTGITPDVDDVELNVRFYQNGSGNTLYLLQSRATSSGTIFGISGGYSGSKISATWNGGSTTSTITRTSGHVYTVNARFLNGASTLYVRDETAGTEATSTGTYTFAVPTSPFGLFGNYGGNTINANQRIYSAVVKVNGVVVMNYVPVTYNGTAGFYDTVSGEFKGAYTGSLSAGNVVANAYPTEYTYGVGATVYGVPTRANSIFEGWCGNESSTGVLSNCQTGPYVIGTDEIDPKTLHAKWSCVAGYVASGNACVADIIILNWDENNGNYQELPNGQCTYGGDLTLPGEPVNSDAWVFNGWKLVNNEVKAKNSTITDGCVETYTGVTSGTSTGIMAQWCNACNTTHATCTLDTSVPGTCSYTTACESGYHVSPDSPEEPYNMVCIPYTVTYDANGHGNGAVDDNVLYNQTFTTNDAKNTSEFSWANHIVTAWTTVSGGTFPNVGAEYTYNVQSNTTLRANWGECNCTPGSNATACSTTSSNNQCQVNVITCATGFTGTSWSCDGVNCTASCNDSHEHTISLQHTLSGVTGGTTTIYSIDTGAPGTGVYLDEEHQQQMAVSGANSNPVTLPDSFAYTVTYDVSGGTLEAGAANSAQAVATFNGYYNSPNGNSVLYIAGDTGNITADGISAGTSINPAGTWYGRWTLGSVTLPVAYRPGYLFDGWYNVSGVRVGGAGSPYTPDLNSTLYAGWTLCSANNYCPGMETVDGETLYNTVYSCSQATNGKYENSVAASDDISDCYLVLEDGKWVATAGAGKVACTGGYYCNDNATQVYYSDPGDNRRTTGIRNACPANFANTIGTGSTSINNCYKNVILNKRGGTGTLTTGGAGGTYDETTSCYYDTDCTLPDSTILQLTGHTFHGGWTDQADTDCDNTTRVFNMPHNYPDTDTFYACRTTDRYTVDLKDGRDTSITFETVYPTYGEPMPTPLTVTPTRTDGAHTTYVFKGYFDTTAQGSSSGTKYYKEDLSSSRNWNKTQNGAL